MGIQATGQYLCTPCNDAGLPLEKDSAEGDEDTENENDLKSATYFDNIYIGMQCFGGVVGEIYPNMDKVTINKNDGEIPHLELSKACAKILNVADTSVPKAEDVQTMD